MSDTSKVPRRRQPPVPPPPSVPPRPRTGAPDAGPDAAADDGTAKKKIDPTRFGDWEKNGRCIDF